MAPQSQTIPHLDREFRATRRYALEMAVSVALLAGLSRLRYVPVASPALETVLKLAPIAAVWLILIVTVRYYFRIDEFQRLKYLQSLSLTAGIVACLTWSYPYAKSVFALPAMDEWSIPFAIVFVVVTALLNMLRLRAN